MCDTVNLKQSAVGAAFVPDHSALCENVKNALFFFRDIHGEACLLTANRHALRDCALRHVVDHPSQAVVISGFGQAPALTIPFSGKQGTLIRPETILVKQRRPAV